MPSVCLTTRLVRSIVCTVSRSSALVCVTVNVVVVVAHLRAESATAFSETKHSGAVTNALAKVSTQDVEAVEPSAT